MKILRRILRHLTRVRVGWMGTLVLAVILVLNTDWIESDSGSSRVLEIVLGTAISLALLPSEPFRIWNLKARVLAETVPMDKLDFVAREVVEALAIQSNGSVQSGDVTTLWKSFSKDVRQILVEPSRIVKDLQYRIVISEIGTQSKAARVNTEIETIRYSDVDVPLQVTLCSDVLALESEFRNKNSGCVLREMVPLLANETHAAWAERVMFGVRSVIINGETCEIVEHGLVTYDSANSIAIRIVFSGKLLKNQQARIIVRTEFEVQSLEEFPIRFSSYYCIGATRIFFELNGDVGHFDVHNFLPMGFSGYDLVQTQEKSRYSVSLTTPDISVLAPGAGLLISWSNDV